MESMGGFTAGVDKGARIKLAGGGAKSNCPHPNPPMMAANGMLLTHPGTVDARELASRLVAARTSGSSHRMAPQRQRSCPQSQAVPMSPVRSQPPMAPAATTAAPMAPMAAPQPPQHSPMPTGGSTCSDSVEPNQAPWHEQFAPTRVADVAVAPTTVATFVKWLAHRLEAGRALGRGCDEPLARARVMVLRGGCGVGKAALVKAAASEAGAQVVEPDVDCWVGRKDPRVGHDTDHASMHGVMCKDVGVRRLTVRSASNSAATQPHIQKPLVWLFRGVDGLEPGTSGEGGKREEARATMAAIVTFVTATAGSRCPPIVFTLNDFTSPVLWELKAACGPGRMLQLLDVPTPGMEEARKALTRVLRLMAAQSAGAPPPVAPPHALTRFSGDLRQAVMGLQWQGQAAKALGACDDVRDVFAAIEAMRNWGLGRVPYTESADRLLLDFDRHGDRMTTGLLLNSYGGEGRSSVKFMDACAHEAAAWSDFEVACQWRGGAPPAPSATDASRLGLVGAIARAQAVTKVPLRACWGRGKASDGTPTIPVEARAALKAHRALLEECNPVGLTCYGPLAVQEALQAQKSCMVARRGRAAARPGLEAAAGDGDRDGDDSGGVRPYPFLTTTEFQAIQWRGLPL